MARLVRLAGGALVGAAALLFPTAPASAWGPIMHAAAAGRAFDVIVARQPWLAPHRDAFLWGAVAADVQDAPGATHLSITRTHGAAGLANLWREAQAGGPITRAFALGWIAHVAADDARAGWLAADERGAALRAAVADVGPPPPPVTDEAANSALIDLAVDAAALPRTGGLLREVAQAAWRHAGTPAGAPIAGLLQRTLGVDEATYVTMAGLTAAMGARGPDRYLQERARFGRVERWLEAARSAGVRGAVGEASPLVARVAEAALQGMERRLAAAPAPAP